MFALSTFWSFCKARRDASERSGASYLHTLTYAMIKETWPTLSDPLFRLAYRAQRVNLEKAGSECPQPAKSLKVTAGGVYYCLIHAVLSKIHSSSVCVLAILPAGSGYGKVGR